MNTIIGPITRRTFAAALGGAGLALAEGVPPGMTAARVPDNGIQPRIATGPDGKLHLLYYKGDPFHGDLYYVHSTDEAATFSSPVRVNSQEGSAIAAGTIRGGQIAIGRNGRVYVAWNGSSIAQPVAPVNPDSGKPGQPMLFARLNESGTKFEPQRNLMTLTSGLDGGGSLAADQAGGVFVAWHGRLPDAAKGEAGRQVFWSRSSDDGKTFTAEAPVWDQPAGACGCCGLSIFAARSGTSYILFRSATENVHRDVYLLSAARGAKMFHGGILHRWEINACPMSSMSFSEGRGGVLASWETEGQVYFAPVDTRKPVAASETAAKRKHSYLAKNAAGQTLMTWIEGSGWQKGGTAAWRLFDAGGQPVSPAQTVGPSPVWSFAAPFSRRDGGFTILY
ncbi:MAG: hypothetical protein ABJF23_09925 [Bryobacteraceae bacterium]